jgi:hypothetical protein
MTSRSLAWLAAFMVVSLVLGAPLLARWLVPDSFEPDTVALLIQVISLTAVGFALYLVMVQVVFIEERTTGLAVTSPLVAVLFIFAGSLGLPEWGLGGLALVTVGAFLLLAVATASLARVLRPVDWPWSSYAAAAAVAGTAVAVAVTAPSPESVRLLAVQAVAGVVVALATKRFWRGLVSTQPLGEDGQQLTTGL